ncbi:MAG: hypothetical protein ABFD89_07155 [Bryobacteraceae bacterium]
MLTKEKLLSALMAIIAALGAWNLRATLDIADRLARIEERQVAADSRTADIRARLVDVETRIQYVEVRIAELRRRDTAP